MLRVASFEQAMDIAQNRPRAIVVVGMLGCEPCKRLYNALIQDEALLASTAIAYVGSRPSHARVLLKAFGLTGVPTILFFENCLNIQAPADVADPHNPLDLALWLTGNSDGQNH